MNYNLQIQKILLQVDEAASSADKINLLKSAIGLADLHNDIEWGYDLRLDLMEQSEGAIKCSEALPAFIWLLDACDQNPDLFEEDDLLWKYKWMIDSAARNSKVSIEQIMSIIEDFKVRLLKNGYGLRGYYDVLISTGFLTENMEMVGKYIDVRRQQPLDDMSDSLAHDLYDEVLYCFAISDIDGALEKELQLKEMESSSNMFSINTCYAESFVRAKRFDMLEKYIAQAEENFKELKKESYLTVTLSSLILALSYTDSEKAWRYLEQYSHWLTNAEEYDMLVFELNILPLLKQGGQRSLQLSSAFPFYQSNGVYNVADIFDYVYKECVGLAQAFDTRNCNQSFTDQIKQILE